MCVKLLILYCMSAIFRLLWDFFFILKCMFSASSFFFNIISWVSLYFDQAQYFCRLAWYVNEAEKNPAFVNVSFDVCFQCVIYLFARVVLTLLIRKLYGCVSKPRKLLPKNVEHSICSNGAVRSIGCLGRELKLYFN